MPSQLTAYGKQLFEAAMARYIANEPLRFEAECGPYDRHRIFLGTTDLTDARVLNIKSEPLRIDVTSVMSPYKHVAETGIMRVTLEMEAPVPDSSPPLRKQAPPEPDVKPPAARKRMRVPEGPVRRTLGLRRR